MVFVNLAFWPQNMVGKQRYSVSSSVKIGFCHIFLFSFLISYVISFSFFALFSFQCYLCSHYLMSLWFSPCHGFHPHVVSTFLWFPPSHGYSVVYTLLWFPPFRGFHPAWLLHGFHPPIVWIFTWFPPSCGYFVVSLLWFAPSRGLHPTMVSTLPWLLHGVHPEFWLELA